MDALKVKWNKSAFRLFVQIVNWYSCNVGQKAAINVTQDFFNAIHHISLYPEIGMFDKKRSTSTKIYRSFLIHPKYRLIYRQTKTTIRIVDIVCNQMNPSL